MTVKEHRLTGLLYIVKAPLPSESFLILLGHPSEREKK
jgi:hypothetical protein